MVSPRELRLLMELVKNDRVFVGELRKRIGALNPAQTKYELKNRGWKITTGYVRVLDRDGRACRPGYYRLEPEEKARARLFLEEMNRAALTSAPVETSISEPSNSKIGADNIKGGENDQPSK